MSKTSALLLVLATLVLPTRADETARQPFADDYTPHPCASGAPAACIRGTVPQLAQLAGLRGYVLGREWIAKHGPGILDRLEPFCAKTASCYAVPGNQWTFCNDVVARQVESICDDFDEATGDRVQCRMLVKVAIAIQDSEARSRWNQVRECAAAVAEPGDRAMDVWMKPDPIRIGTKGRYSFYAVDSRTGLPVQARIAIANQKLAAVDVPDGRPTAFYEFDWTPALERVPNAAGHRDVVAPVATLQAEGYPPVTLSLPIEVPQVELAMKPAKLRRGRNEVTITATDVATGEPVDLRVMAGDRVAGRTNRPFEIEIDRGNNPEIWVTSLYDHYSDVVVLPASR